MLLQPLVPYCDFGDQTLLAGVPTVGLWGQRQAIKRGGANERDLPKLAFSSAWPPRLSSPHGATTEPGDGGRLTWYISRTEAAIHLGTRSMAWGALPQPNLAASEEEKGGQSVGLPLSTGYLEKQNVINIPILPLKKKKVFSMHNFPEDFQCIPRLKNKFPQKYIFKACDTVVFVVHPVLEVAWGCVPLPLLWGTQDWPATSPTPKSPSELAHTCWGDRVFAGDRILGYAEKPHHRLGSR